MKLVLHLSDDVIDALKSAIERSITRAHDDLHVAHHTDAEGHPTAHEARQELRWLTCALDAINDQIDAHTFKYGVTPI